MLTFFMLLETPFFRLTKSRLMHIVLIQSNLKPIKQPKNKKTLKSDISGPIVFANNQTIKNKIGINPIVINKNILGLILISFIILLELVIMLLKLLMEFKILFT